MSKTTITIFAVIILALVGGGAFYTFANPGNEYADAFCPELSSAKVYEEKGLGHYKMLIPGKGQWVFRTENDFRKDWKINDKTLTYLADLQESMKQKNAELVIVVPPIRGLVHSKYVQKADRKKYGLADTDKVWNDYESMIEKMRSAGIHVVGATKSEVGNDDFYYKRNHHWTAQGAELIAENVAAEVKDLPAYKKIPESEYETVEKNPVEYESSFESGFEEICKTTLAPENPMEYETRPKAGATSNEELFSENKEPQVVLLGTSNSVLGSSYANFEGYLKQHLSRDVMNASYVGAGIDTPLIAYLNSDHFKNGEPKIVIWEVPSYYDLDVMDDKIFNQAIPGVYGSCDDDALIARTFSAVPDEKSFTLFNRGYSIRMPGDAQESAESDDEDADGAADEPQTASAAPFTRFSTIADGNMEKYLHLTFSKPVEEKFKIEFVYGDGGTKIQAFSRSGRYPHDGEFYTLFPRVEDDKTLKEVILSTSKDFPDDASLEVSVCAAGQQS